MFNESKHITTSYISVYVGVSPFSCAAVTKRMCQT